MTVRRGFRTIRPTQGSDANTNDDIEPANQWGNDLGIVKYQISLYRREFDAKPPQDVAAAQ
jgi:hypothetical protein